MRNCCATPAESEQVSDPPHPIYELLRPPAAWYSAVLNPHTGESTNTKDDMLSGQYRHVLSSSLRLDAWVRGTICHHKLPLC